MRCASIVFNLAVLAWTLSAADVPRSFEQDAFTEQVERLVRSLTLPEERLKVIPQVLKQVEMVLSTRWPGCRAFVFGSVVTGLATAESDIDCYVQLPNQVDSSVVIEQAKATLENFPTLFKDFRTKPIARVPLVSFTHIATGLNLDISFNGMDGVKNSELVGYLINSDKRVLNMCKIVKYWAKLHKITGSKRMPSYGMMTLVIFYLQQIYIMPPINWMQKRAKPYFFDNWNIGFDEIAFTTRNSAPLYELLGGFFEYYNSFDFDENIVSPFVGHSVQRRLFENRRSPGEFELYRHNIANNITQPLNMTRVTIQDSFYHNKNLAAKLDVSMNSTFVTQFQRAACVYRANNKSVFLDEIL